MTPDRFVAQLLGFPRDFGPCAYMGYEDGDGNLVAGVVYHNWSPESGVIEVSAASTQRRWTTRSIVREIFSYPFRELKCRLVVGRMSENNARSRRIWRSLGAVEYIIPELRAPQEAEVISVLTAEAWNASKFMRGHDGKAEASRAA